MFGLLEEDDLMDKDAWVCATTDGVSPLRNLREAAKLGCALVYFSILDLDDPKDCDLEDITNT
jgi:hypothetical protein